MIGNIGDVIQKFPSIDTQVDILIKSTLVCVENSDIPHHLSKSALQVLKRKNEMKYFATSVILRLHIVFRSSNFYKNPRGHYNSIQYFLPK